MHGFTRNLLILDGIYQLKEVRSDGALLFLSAAERLTLTPNIDQTEWFIVNSNMTTIVRINDASDRPQNIRGEWIDSLTGETLTGISVKCFGELVLQITSKREEQH